MGQKAIYEVSLQKPDGYDNLSEFKPHDPEFLALWHDKFSNKIYKFNNKTPAYWKENEVIDLNELDALVEYKKKHNTLPEFADKVKLYKNQWETVADDYARDINKTGAGIQKSYASYKVIEKAYAAEGKIVPAQYTGLEITNFLNQLRGVKEKDYVLQQALETINVPYIEGKILKRAGSDLEKYLNTSDEITPVRDTFTSVAYEIKMHGTHIMRNEDIYLRPLAADPYQSTLNGIQQRVTKAKAEITKDVLDAFTGTTDTGDDWGALTGANSSFRPMDSLFVSASGINTADGTPEIMIMNPQAAAMWNTNTFNLGAGTTQPATFPNPGQAQVVKLLGIGYTAYADPLWNVNDIMFMQRDAALMFQGPTKVATYDDVHHRADGYYFWTYYGGKWVEQEKAYKINDVYTP